jgi:hypothetical protein
VRKKDVLINAMRPIIDNPAQLEKFIIENSNLPGPRGNLELAFGFAEIYDNLTVLLKWVQISEDQADVNNPRSFLAFCSAVCLGKLYTKRKNKELILILKKLANDGRWRMREAVAFGFQIIGENDFNELKMIFSDWIKDSNNLEKRAILVSLAHPKFLNKERAKFCFEITDMILRQMDKQNNFDVLKKGLGFTISVYAATNPNLGLNFIQHWIGKDQVIDRILKQNLKKNRLIKKDPERVNELLNAL